MQFIEDYHSDVFKNENIDSLAIYYQKNWIIATAKNTHRLLIFNLSNLKLIKTVGNNSIFNRPNGISVIDNLCFVVERDGKKVQVFELPAFKKKGAYGDRIFKKPYGITIRKMPLNEYYLYITDNEIDISNIHIIKYINGIFTYISKFGGDTLKESESIIYDDKYGRLYVADEGNKRIYMYTINRFKRYIIFSMSGDPEGIDIYKDYIIATEQTKGEFSKFHVFDRKLMLYRGYFKGVLTKNTDGIKICKDGNLFAVDDDKRICCINFENNWKNRILKYVKQNMNVLKSFNVVI